jgi:hypothetical protein
MVYLIILFLLAVSYHTFSYSIFLIKKEKNKLAAFGTILLSLLNLAVPIYILLSRY